MRHTKQMLKINVLKITPPDEDPNVDYEYDYFYDKYEYDIMTDEEMQSPKNSALKEIAIPYMLNYTGYDYDKIQQHCEFESTPKIVAVSDEITTFSDGKKKMIMGNERLRIMYSKRKRDIFWVFGKVCVGCWFGHQKFREDFCDFLKQQGIKIELDGHYKLNEQQIINIVSKTHSYMEMLKMKDEDTLFYYETKE